jgi:hypothetical protein
MYIVISMPKRTSIAFGVSQRIVELLLLCRTKITENLQAPQKRRFS